MTGTDIVIATPGRLLDFLNMTDFKTRKPVIRLERTFMLVLDEADRYLLFLNLTKECLIWVLKQI